jgi:hypothetical protein
MADNKMEIEVSLNDKATDGLKVVKSAVDDVGKSTQDVGKKTDEATKTIEQRFRAAGKEIRDFTKALFVITAIVATVAKITGEWAKKNQETHDALSSLKDNVLILAGNLGSILAPAIIGISNALKSVMPTITTFFENVRSGFNKFNQWVTFGVQYWVAFAAAIKEGSTTTEASGIALNVAGDAAKIAGEKFNAAFSENTSTKVNDLEVSLNKLGETWVAWEDSTTQGDMISMTTQMTMLSQTISAYESYYSSLAMLEDSSTMNFVKNMQAKAQFNKYLVDNTNTAMQNILNITTKASTAFYNGFATTMTNLILEGGKFKDAMKEIFKNFATAVIQEIMAIIAKLLVMKAIMLVLGILSAGAGTAAGAGAGAGASGGEAVSFGGGSAELPMGFMHKGGMIRAHSGLAIDEVPIIAQTGEGILSRSGMANLGGAGVLNRLNGGGGVSNQTIHIEINYPSIRSNDDIDSLTEAISSRLAREAERL